MSAQAPSSREIDRFRDRADRFIADLDEEYYLHYAGLKDTLDVEQLYERYDDLTRLETAQNWKARRPSSGASPARASSAT